jgi:hypothetical protein
MISSEMMAFESAFPVGDTLRLPATVASLLS